MSRGKRHKVRSEHEVQAQLDVEGTTAELRPRAEQWRALKVVNREDLAWAPGARGEGTGVGTVHG